MFIHYLKYCCSIFVILTFQGTAYAQAYKWVDENGQTHFSQQAPVDAESEVIKTQPGPKTTPEQSQQAVDELIQQQQNDIKTREEAKLEREQEQKKAESKSKKCDAAKNNLQKYQDSPNGRTRNADGEYIRLDEIDRQNKIKQLRQDIQKHCS